MPWIRLDDAFGDHPKIAEAGPLAAWLHTKALIYCGRHLTDGRIPRSIVASLVDWSEVYVSTGGNDFAGSIDHPDNLLLAASLVAIGLWHELGAAYEIHDYLEYQPSRLNVLAEREKTKARVQRFRIRNRVTNATRNGHVTLPPIPSRSHPDPKTEQKKPEETISADAGAPPECEFAEGTFASRVEEQRAAVAKDSTNPGAPSERFDFEAVYAKYPRKEGRKQGLQRFKAQITTRLKYDALVRAVGNYASATADSDPKYIKQFSSFMNCWEDYVDGAVPRNGVRQFRNVQQPRAHVAETHEEDL